MNGEIIILNQPEENGKGDRAWCPSECPDCGCENAWNTCFIGD